MRKFPFGFLTRKLRVKRGNVRLRTVPPRVLHKINHQWRHTTSLKREMFCLGYCKYTSLFTNYTPNTTLIIHYNVVCTTHIKPTHLCTTTIAQKSASPVKMLSDLPSFLLLERNRLLELFAFVNNYINDHKHSSLHVRYIWLLWNLQIATQMDPTYI